MAGKTCDRFAGDRDRLYQLGNWMAGKTWITFLKLSAPIVPTGELDGRQDYEVLGNVLLNIVPTGELDGRQDS